MILNNSKNIEPIILLGAFNLNESVWNAIAFDGNFNIQHIWNLSGGDMREEAKMEGSLYGAIFLDDGSIITLSRNLERV